MTKSYKSKKILFFWLSLLSWLGLCGFLIAYGVSTAVPKEASELGRQLMDILMPLAVTYIIALVAVIFIREKLRNTVWIVNVVLAALLLGDVMLYITLFAFALDEFVLVPLYRHYKQKYIINKEIDKRL